MKHTLLFTALGLVAFGAAAQEVGNVISTVPVVQQVAVPRTNCVPGQVQQPMTSGMGGLGGAVVGGLIGSQIGHGAGQIAAGLVGTTIGAIVGNNMESNDIAMRQAATPNCVTENTYENRTVAYNVTYEYGGRQYTTQMPYDPGSTIRLSVSPVGQASSQYPAPVAGGSAVTAPPMQAMPAPVVVAQAPVMVPAPVVVQPYPVYPAYPYPVYRPYYPQVGVSLGFVFSGHRHRHWR